MEQNKIYSNGKWIPVYKKEYNNIKCLYFFQIYLSFVRLSSWNLFTNLDAWKIQCKDIHVHVQQCKKCGSENQHKTTSLTSHTISFTDLWLQTKSEGHTPTPADGLAIRDKLLYLPGQSHKLTGRQTLQKSILV